MVHVGDRDGRRELRRERPAGDLGQPFGPDPEHELGQQVGERRLQRHHAREPQRLLGHPPREDLRHLLVRPVLQQPGEQQVTGLQQGEVLLVLHLARGQQPGRLEVEQGGRDQQEVARLVEVPLGAPGADVGDELVGDLVERHLGDVELVLGDQPEQQVEGALEHLEVDVEAHLFRIWGALVSGSVTRAIVHQKPVARGPADEHLTGQLAVGGGAHRTRVELGDRLTGQGGVGEADGPVDDGVEDLVAEALHDRREHLAGVEGAGVVHGGEEAVDLRASC